jgi:hypothetical protein
VCVDCETVTVTCIDTNMHVCAGWGGGDLRYPVIEIGSFKWTHLVWYLPHPFMPGKEKDPVSETLCPFRIQVCGQNPETW